MEELAEKLLLNQEVEETGTLINRTKRTNPGLRALLSVKHFTVSLENDYTELLQIEADLQELNLHAQSVLETNTTAEAVAEWKLLQMEMNNAITGINEALSLAKEKATHIEKVPYPELWNALAVHFTAFKNKANEAVQTGFKLLPETAHAKWEQEYVATEVPLLESLISSVESCRILLQMIERYTPDELNAITKIIADQVPIDFSYEEAKAYQNDYYKALINFKKEFKQEKNLWDKFLDILAGGTHQLPSERVMMERWLDGDKGDL